MPLPIAFVKNTADDTHCFQACLKMVLRFYFGKNYTFSYLDKVTAHKKGMWTWLSAGLIFLAQSGFEVINIENFSYRLFARNGDAHLRKIWNPEVYETQKKFSNLKQEKKLAKKLVSFKAVRLIQRSATLEDMLKLTSNGYILLCTVNPFVLKRQKGYASHIVVLTAISKNQVAFHDPGLPPVKNRRVKTSLFMKAMSYPTKNDASLIALRLRKRN